MARVKLSILDDWGPEALNSNQARDMLEIVKGRYDKASLIITSQVPINRWHDLIGVPTLADAILNRVVHNAYRIELAGESLRKRRSSPGESDVSARAGSPDPRRGEAVDKAGSATALWKDRYARFAHRHPIRPAEPTILPALRSPRSAAA